jgi:hypothetical protein
VTFFSDADNILASLVDMGYDPASASVCHSILLLSIVVVSTSKFPVVPSNCPQATITSLSHQDQALSLSAAVERMMEQDAASGNHNANDA